MAATDELTEALDLARRALDDLHGAIGEIGYWEPVGRRWRLGFELTLDGLTPAGPIPPKTAWYAVVDGRYPLGDIDIYPAKIGGITETFAHQLPNDPGSDDLPWRTGKVCLVDTVHGRELAARRDEPIGAYQRLGWHVGRAIGWLERASHGLLLKPGEPFELPVFGQGDDGATIAFVEGAETFEAWKRSGTMMGLADLAQVVDDRMQPVLAVIGWRNLRRRPLPQQPTWGTRIAGAKVVEDALWFRFDRLMVRPPWRAPQTWQEVHDFATEQGVDFAAYLRQGTPAIRDGKPHFVLLGFPIERVMGETPSRYAWVAFELAPINKTNRARTPVPGFRPHVAALIADRRTGALAADYPLGWIRTENWHADELAARGRFKAGLIGRSVAVLGAGAFGSELGRLLVRAGVHDLAVFDAGRLEAGNLARHELSLPELRQRKAEALATRLNALSPSAHVVGYVSSFPPTDDAGKAALDRADIIIDATASEVVAAGLGRYPWAGERRFASVSFSFGAEKLYLYLADGNTFPSEYFATQIAPWLKADERPAEDFPHEGTGCWSSVFPARADDVALLAAIATRQLDDRLAKRIETPELIVYGRGGDGTVAILDLPPAPGAITTYLAEDLSLAVDIEPAALETMVELSMASGRLETGGVLLGRYSEFGDRVVVTKATGPSRDSVRGRFSFIRGVAGLTRRMGAEWAKGIYYIGEWHFHPFASPTASPRDLTQIKAFARDDDLRCPSPALIVLGGDPTAIYSMTVGVIADGQVVELARRP